MVICGISQKQEENKIHCLPLSFIHSMEYKFALSVVMEFLKRHQPCVQNLDKGLAQSEPGHRSTMLRKTGAKSQAINIVFMLHYN